jgi:hypothetical protein
LESVDTSTSVKLRAEDLVSLAESLKLSCQVAVLSLEDSSVTLQGVFLGE